MGRKMRAESNAKDIINFNRLFFYPNFLFISNLRLLEKTHFPRIATCRAVVTKAAASPWFHSLELRLLKNLSASIKYKENSSGVYLGRMIYRQNDFYKPL